MPIDVAVEADTEAGTPIILTAMAEMLGYQVIPIDDPRITGSRPVTIKDALIVANEAADVVKAITEALANDDRIDGTEERIITREIDEAVRAMIDVLHRIKVRA
jgi:hypothetical protein